MSFPQDNLYRSLSKGPSARARAAQELGYRSVAEYLFKLIEVDKEKNLIEKT